MVDRGNRQKTALITGLSGQDGHYLSRLLVRAGVAVHGVLGPSNTPHRFRAEVGITPHTTKLDDRTAVHELVAAVAPDFVFHLAGLSSVAGSWTHPVETVELNAVSTTTLLDACLRVQDRLGRNIVVVNASSAEIFAGSEDSPQNESTPINPTSPYGASKALGHMMCHIYRTKGLQTCNAILYNHESPLRSPRFVTRKITMGVAAIARGDTDAISLGNLAARRDWGWAPDYVEAMYRMATHGVGDDFVIATGVSHSISDFVQAAFAAAGMYDWQERVRTDTDLLRVVERADMVGDPSHAARVLDWRPSTTFNEIVTQMVEYDLRSAGVREPALQGEQ